jgi:ubiquinone biosynthesis protein
LERLQESAAPADRSAAIAVVEADLGPIEEAFAEFDAQALGSASLGQTYLATLPDQRRVVVKVQRPGIDEAVYRDLDILGRFARTAEQRTDWATGMGLSGIVRDFSQRTREELDYRLEAANMAAAALALEDEALIAVPAAVDGLCSRRVLVQEKAEGASVGRAGALDALTPEQRQGLADTLLGAMVRSMVAGEVFHADPHPGNIFVADDGRLILIDWGAVGRLDPYERSGVSDLLRALQSRDAGLMRQAALSLGTSTDPIDEDALERQLARLMGRAIGPDGRLDPVLFRDALTVFREVGLQLPQSTATLMRTLATLMGTLDVISPGYALAEAAGRIGGELAIQQFTGGGLKEVMTQEALRSAQVLRRLPSAVDSIARTAARGELRLRTSLFSDQRDVAAITRLVDRAVLGMIAAALAVASAVLLSSNAGPQVTADFSVVELFGAMGMVFALVLALRVVASALPSQANDG